MSGAARPPDLVSNRGRGPPCSWRTYPAHRMGLEETGWRHSDSRGRDPCSDVGGRGNGRLIRSSVRGLPSVSRPDWVARCAICAWGAVERCRMPRLPKAAAEPAHGARRHAGPLVRFEVGGAAVRAAEQLARGAEAAASHASLGSGALARCERGSCECHVGLSLLHRGGSPRCEFGAGSDGECGPVLAGCGPARRGSGQWCSDLRPTRR